MSVQLSSLKVSAAMDSSEYVRGATALEDSNKRIAASGQVTGGGIDKLTGQVKLLQQQMDALRGANDNARSSFGGVLGGIKDVGSGFENTTANILNTVNHMKLLVLGAYALSPAFRGVINSGVAVAFGAMGTAAATATKTVIGFAAPALSFFARITAPIALAVAAWESFNYVINLGSDILKKYTDAERSLFASNVNDNLTKLTKFQGDTISLQQVEYATDLAARLKEAKQTISDFFAVQFDLTEPALRLQGAWVRIVETIAKGVDLLNSVSGIAQTIGNLPIWNLMNFGWHLPGAMTQSQVIQPSQTPDNSAALAIAQQRLAAGMGSSGTFANRFSQDISALAAKPDEKKTANDARDAWDRATAAIDKHAAKLSADTIAVGQSAATQEQLRAEFSLLEAAKLSDRDVTDRQIEAYTNYRATMTASQALQAAGIKWSADEVAAFDRTTASIKLRTNELEKAKVAEAITFGRQTAFLTSEDVQIAQQLKTIYGNDVPAALASSQAAALRLNNTFQDFSNTSRDTLKGFATDMRTSLQAGATAWESFQKAGVNA